MNECLGPIYIRLSLESLCIWTEIPCFSLLVVIIDWLQELHELMCILPLCWARILADFVLCMILSALPGCKLFYSPLGYAHSFQGSITERNWQINLMCICCSVTVFWHLDYHPQFSHKVNNNDSMCFSVVLAAMTWQSEVGICIALNLSYYIMVLSKFQWSHCFHYCTYNESSRFDRYPSLYQ